MSEDIATCIREYKEPKMFNGTKAKAARQLIRLLEIEKAAKHSLEWFAGFPHGGPESFEKDTAQDLYSELALSIGLPK